MTESRNECMKKQIEKPHYSKASRFVFKNEEKRVLFSQRAKDNCGKFTKSTFINKWINVIEEVERG